MIKQAIIPLAGLGTRLLPLTSVIPKELLPINGKPGLEYIIDECLYVSFFLFFKYSRIIIILAQILKNNIIIAGR